MKQDACHFCKCSHALYRRKTDEHGGGITFRIHYFTSQGFTGNPWRLLRAPATEWSKSLFFHALILKMLIDLDLQSKSSHLNFSLTHFSSILSVVNSSISLVLCKSNFTDRLRMCWFWLDIRGFHIVQPESCRGLFVSCSPAHHGECSGRGLK